MENLEPSLQQPSSATVVKTTWKILATLMKFFLVFLLIGFSLVALKNEAGAGVLLMLWPIAMFALPALVIYVIFTIISKTLVVTGISDKPDEKGKIKFLGKNTKKTLIIVSVIILVTALVIYFNLHRYY